MIACETEAAPTEKACLPIHYVVIIAKNCLYVNPHIVETFTILQRSIKILA